MADDKEVEKLRRQLAKMRGVLITASLLEVMVPNERETLRILGRSAKEALDYKGESNG